MTQLRKHGRAALHVERLEERLLLSSYTFSLIADTSTGPFASLGRSPALNNAGTVAFAGAILGEQTCLATGSGGPLTPIACDEHGNLGLGTAMAINDTGTVAYLRTDLEFSYISISDGVTQRDLYSTIGNRAARFGAPSLNASGTVAFVTTQFGGVASSIVAGNAGPLTTIADTNGPFSAFGPYPSMNGRGQVAFVAAAEPWGGGLFVGDGTSLTTIADTSYQFGGFGPAPSINNVGMVAFYAIPDPTERGSGIFLAGGGLLSTVAETNGSFADFGPAVALGDVDDLGRGGRVAFVADLWAGGTGIFTGSDPQADRVIATGDPLFDSTVASLGFFHQGINEGGQIAFFAQLADGRQVIVRADPENFGAGGGAAGTSSPSGLPAVTDTLLAASFTGEQGRLIRAADGSVERLFIAPPAGPEAKNEGDWGVDRFHHDAFFQGWAEGEYQGRLAVGSRSHQVNALSPDPSEPAIRILFNNMDDAQTETATAR
jgi:hypothetical protein